MDQNTVLSTIMAAGLVDDIYSKGDRMKESESNKLIDDIFFNSVFNGNAIMAGDKSGHALEEVEKVSGKDFFELESLISEGYSENALNGFRYGFKCAFHLFLEAFSAPPSAAYVATRADEK